MGFGAGVIEGETVSAAYGIRPGDDIYVDHTGLNYNAQTAGNIAYYEVTAEGDQLDFRLPGVASGYDEVTVRLFTVFGPTDFDVQVVSSGDTLIAEQSGFDSDVWTFTTLQTGETFRITDFDTTTAAIYPYIQVAEVQ